MPYRKDMQSRVKYFRPKNPQKYLGDAKKIVSRSGLETRFMQWADHQEQIKFWASEELFLEYINPNDGKLHRYFPDFLIQVQKGDVLKTYLIEVKPMKFTKPPKVPKRQTKGFLAEVKQYATNSAKWEAAKIFSLKHDMEFLILTEADLGYKEYKK